MTAPVSVVRFGKLSAAVLIPFPFSNSVRRATCLGTESAEKSLTPRLPGQKNQIPGEASSLASAREQPSGMSASFVAI